MGIPRQLRVIDTDGAEHFLYLRHNPWKCASDCGVYTKRHRYCVVCGENQWGDDSSWESANFILHPRAWIEVDHCLKPKQCAGDRDAWCAWHSLSGVYHIVPDDERESIDRDPQKQRYEAAFEDTSSPFALHSVRYGRITSKTTGGIPMLCKDNPFFAQPDGVALFSRLRVLDDIPLERRVEHVWWAYAMSMYVDTPMWHIDIIYQYLLECKERAHKIGAHSTESAFSALELRDYMIQWRIIHAISPTSANAPRPRCVACGVSSPVPMFERDNAEAGFCSGCGLRWIVNHRHEGTIRYLEDEFQAYLTSSAPLHTETPASTALCCICMDNAPNATFKDCGHTGFCLECANSIQASKSPHCPTCRAELKEGILRLY